MQLVTIRCSALPLAWTCPGSARRATVCIDTTDESAANGTATHEALEFVVRGQGVPWDDLDAIAKRHGANPDTVKMLVACGAQLWERVKGSFPEPMTEIPFVVEIPE